MTDRTGPGRVSSEPAGLDRAGLDRARPGPALVVRPMTAQDWPAVRDIYQAGIATGNATFETAVPAWPAWDAGHLPGHRLVAVTGSAGAHRVAGDDAVLGWAALSPVSDRCAYAGVAENSLYVHPDHQGLGIGRLLLDALIASAEGAGIWTLQTGIFPENTASIAVHERCGFRIVGRRERLGRLHGTWRDVLLLERRSPNIT